MVISILLFILIGIPMVLGVLLFGIGAFRAGRAVWRSPSIDGKREENLRPNREMDVKLTPDSYKAQP